jgi:hypothetical protein
MTIIYTVTRHLQRSQRGWTLQEMVLPQKTLVFVNGQVY